VGKIYEGSKNYRLSVARALEVHDALNKIGVGGERLLARGYGNWEMIYPFAKHEAQMKFNRRVEIIISDCESIRTIPNHEIPDREEFNLADDPINRYYSDKNYQRDIRNFPKKAQLDLLMQIKTMKENNLDPSQYTYRELLLSLSKRSN
jgi:hypothetical protein